MMSLLDTIMKVFWRVNETLCLCVKSVVLLNKIAYLSTNGLLFFMLFGHNGIGGQVKNEITLV